MFIVVSAGVASADEITVSDLVSETRIVDDTNEIIEKVATVLLLQKLAIHYRRIGNPPAEEPTTLWFQRLISLKTFHSSS